LSSDIIKEFSKKENVTIKIKINREKILIKAPREARIFQKAILSE
jgi:hypothetical protein